MDDAQNKKTIERLPLPAPASGGWLLVLVVGLGLLIFAGWHLWRGGLPAAGWGIAGAGLFLSGFALVVLLHREPAGELCLDPARGLLVLELGDRQRVDIPIAAIEQAGSYAGSGHDMTVALIKRDGGVIELGTMPESRASAFVAAVGEVLDATAKPSGATGVARLERFAGIEVARDGGPLSLSWRARAPATTIAALGPLGGLWLVTYAFHLHQPGVGTLAAMAFAGTLALAFVIFNLVQVGVTQRLLLDEQTLTIERVRFGRAIQTRRLALAGIDAVDYSNRLSTIGAGLSIRTGKGAALHRAAGRAMASAVEEPDDRDAMVGATKSLAALLAAGVEIPCGALPLAAKIALDLAIGEEIAARLGPDRPSL